MRIFIAFAFAFVFIALTDAGVIKNIFTNVFGGRKENSQVQSTGNGESEQRTPGQSPNNDYRPGVIGNEGKPNGQYGAGGTYSKRPLVVGGTTEKYKNTSWYIENEDYLSPNRNETQQQKPNEQYGAAGTYPVRPSGGSQTPGYGNFGSNQQQRPSEFSNINSNYNQGPNKESTRGSIPNGNAGDSVVLKSEEITCHYSNLKEEVEKRKLRCNDEDCKVQQVNDKSSLWACGPLKCSVADVDFSMDHGNKPLLECHLLRSIIQVPLRCGEDEKEVKGKCRKIFN